MCGRLWKTDFDRGGMHRVGVAIVLALENMFSTLGYVFSESLDELDSLRANSRS